MTQLSVIKGAQGWEAKASVTLYDVVEKSLSGDKRGKRIMCVRIYKDDNKRLILSLTGSFQEGVFVSHLLFSDYSERFVIMPCARLTKNAINSAITHIEQKIGGDWVQQYGVEVQNFYGGKGEFPNGTKYNG